MTHARMDAAVGATAAIGAVAASASTSWAFQGATNPVLSVASYVRDHTPGSIAVPLVHLVGHADKPLLVAGTCLLLLAAGAGIGVLSRGRWWLTVALVTVLSGIGIVAVIAEKNPDLPSLASGFVGLVVWLGVLSWLVRDREADVVLERRGVLRGIAIVVGLSALGTAGSQWIGRGHRIAEAARRALRLPVTDGVVPAGAELGTPGGLAWRTSNADFYQIHTALVPPALDPATWRLRIHGMVDHEINLTFDDLLKRRVSEGWVTLCCVSNPVGGDLISNAWWSGVRIADLLAEAGVHPDADAVRQTSYDGWDCGTPLSALTDDRLAMLAVAMNGEPLPIEHGFPVRMVVPGLYGYVSACKWLVDLEVTRFDRFEAYWTQRGWSPKGPIKTESRIVVPGDGGHLAAGAVAIGGVAWSQHTGIAKVEVSIDGGPWKEADLGGVPDNDTWVQWRLAANLGAGRHHAAVRATDKSGYTQTSVRTDVVPDGATGWHTVEFSAG